MKQLLHPDSVGILPGYDVDITGITLIHRFEFKPQIYDTLYQNGRNSFGFVYIIAGNATYLCADEQFTVKKGAVLFLPAQSRYTIVNDHADSFLHYTLNFTLSPDAAVNGSLYPYLAGSRILRLSTRNPGLFEAAFAKILATWNGKQSGFKLDAKAQLYALFRDFFLEYEAAQMNPKDLHRVGRAKQYIDEHFTEALSLPQLAALCGLSETHFRRLFLSVFRISPIEYQISLRLMKAKDLLQTKIYSVSEIAELCGFSDANYFSRLFKTRTGISPLKYKQLH